DQIDNYRGALRSETQYQEFFVLDTLENPLIDVGTGDTASNEVQIAIIPKYFPKSLTSYTYSHQLANPVYDYLVTPTFGCASFQYYRSHDANQRAEASSGTCEGNCPLPSMLSTCQGPFYTKKITYQDIWRRLISKKTWQYEYENDYLSRKTLYVNEEYSYNNSNRLIREKRTQRSENGKTVENKLNYYYSAGPYPSGVFSDTEIDQFTDNREYNRLKDLVFLEGFETIKEEDIALSPERLLGQKKVIYSNPLDSGSFNGLSKTFSRKSLSDPFEIDVEVTQYDEYENILEFKTADGLNHVHIYGYEGSVLLATVQNATYQQVIAGVDLAILKNPPSSGGQTAVSDQLDILRANAIPDQVMATTYYYNDQMQLSKVVDPNGLKVSYYYDDFGRLLRSVDHEGNMLTENIYHFRN
ncbi:MAG: RHS repeat domain-containing protein, partial [Bacteroidota bacterium]